METKPSLLVRCLLLVGPVLAVIAVVCVSWFSGKGDPTVSSDDKGPHLPSAFTVSRVADFKEAAAVVGFDIPKSDLYPLHWPYLFIQPGVELGPDVPRKAGAIYDVEDQSFDVTFAPLSFWPDGALSEGDETNYGGWRGCVTRDEYGVDFSAPVSKSDRLGEIWMLVKAPREAEPLLGSFVASLKPVVQ